MELYNRLNIQKTASAKEIKSRFRDLAKIHHPDKGGDAEKFALIKEAYDILMDSVSREKYDETGVIESELNKKQKLHMFLASHIVQIIEEHNSESFDFITEATKFMNNSIKRGRQQKHKISIAITKVENSIDRIHRTDKEDNVLKSLFSSRKEMLKQTAAGIDSELEFFKEVINELEHYKYDFKDEFSTFLSGGYSLETVI